MLQLMQQLLEDKFTLTTKGDSALFTFIYHFKVWHRLSLEPTVNKLRQKLHRKVRKKVITPEYQPSELLKHVSYETIFRCGEKRENTCYFFFLNCF